jgi:maltose-binding protein MalE
MKRSLAITICVAMLLALATCASASQEGKLLIWADRTRAPVLEELGKKFTAKYKVPVEIQELPAAFFSTGSVNVYPGPVLGGLIANCR